MTILINKYTKVVVQGMTGREGTFHTQQMLNYGTNVVAGVSPKKAGQSWNNIPIMETVNEAVDYEDADASIIFVPPQFAAESIKEAIDAGISVIVCITDGIPAHDMIYIRREINQSNAKLIGPNCPGAISPGEIKLGIMPGHIYKKGNIGIISRSGSLSYEIAYNLTNNGFGQSTIVGVGGDAIKGVEHIDCLPLFDNDPETNAVVLIGEIGGDDEEQAAKYIKEQGKKPVVAFLAGKAAPEGKKMGHAGAIVQGGKGSYQSKYEALSDAGVSIAETPFEVVDLLKKVTCVT